MNHDPRESLDLLVDHPVQALAHVFARASARAWFSDVKDREGECTVALSDADLRDAEAREKLCAFAGNTPGLADAIIAQLTSCGVSLECLSSLRVVLRSVDECGSRDNHPLHAATRLRQFIS